MPKPKTLGELQAGFEITFAKGNQRTWQARSYELERLVSFFGKTRFVDSIFKADIETFEAWLWEHFACSPRRRRGYVLLGAQWYDWMEDHEYVEFNFNPFRRYLRRSTRKSV